MAYPNGYFEHRTVQGDRWDLLAYRYYGDASRMSVILDANRSLFLDPIRMPPLILPSGLTLIIPVLDDDAQEATDLPPWKRAGVTS
ncbi:hypothetical protein AN189_02845 [Loktanella sp. 3ANDIMAR09]|uniref:tail protein X n=1 Tax=Loktanella sp. 3ANDIMAR09 TaxID=1225657 RepID=UPI000701CA43|nr:tail protein X [Loktanella sp. 3ANDIMAR09]KQI69380.1 hypothetical protein AN189_02845 [Loktanella sp. 3ANDIMAR09]